MSGTLGVLIAGGRGTRLGRLKATLVFRGVTLLSRARAELAAACDRVVVVAPAGLELSIAAEERVPDAIPDAGPLSALVAGLEAHGFERAVALAVDVPFVDRAVIGKLLAHPSDAPAIVPAPGGRAQPLAAVYRPSAIAPLRAALEGGERAVTRAVLALGTTVLDDAGLMAIGIEPGAFDDIDTREDLARLESRPR